MLTHTLPGAIAPSRAVVIGAGGFVGGAIRRRLAGLGVPVLGLTRREVDLLAPNAASHLAAMLRPGDSVVAVAAIAPCKTAAMLRDNAILAEAIAAALIAVRPAHLVNIGSDAIYADLPVPLTEGSSAAPDSLHGVMHLARETMLRAELTDTPSAFLRPTLIYGARDPHDGYGPNRFRRLAAAGAPIRLFGEGEERRDHVAVEDVAEIVVRALFRRSTGLLNLASGEVTSFRQVAEMVIALSGRAVTIETVPRQGPMPHNGYRPFDIAALRRAFPDFRPTPLAEGLRRAREEEFPDA